MSELRQFRLPDVGEGLTEADIVKWHVQPGDKVTVNQIIVEIETAKAVVELPSPYEGVVAGLLVPEGTPADVGTPIIPLQVGPDPARRDPPPAPPGTARPRPRCARPAGPRGGALPPGRRERGRRRGGPPRPGGRPRPRPGGGRARRGRCRPGNGCPGETARPQAGQGPGHRPVPAVRNRARRLGHA